MTRWRGKNTVKLGYYVPWREMKKGTFWTKYVLSKTKSLLALRLSCFVSYNVFLSRFNAQQWCPRKDQALNSIGSSVHFFLLFLFFLFFFSFCRLTIHCRTLRLPVCASFKLLMKKVWLPNVMCFCGRHGISAWRTHVWEGMRNSTKRIVHVSFRTPSVARVYAFGVFLSSLLSLRGLRRSAFLFQLFFLSPFKQKGHKSVIRNDTKSVTSKLEHVVYLLFWLQMESDCWSIADFLQNSSALSMLTKTYKL